jgi:hypothetical protein
VPNKVQFQGDKRSDGAKLWIALADWDDMHFLLFGDEGVLFVDGLRTKI